MPDLTLYVPTASSPPAGYSLSTLADELGITTVRLALWTMRGQIPAPWFVAGRWLYPLHVADRLAATGPALPGTYPPPPRQWSATKSKCRRKRARKIGGHKPRPAADQPADQTSGAKGGTP